MAPTPANSEVTSIGDHPLSFDDTTFFTNRTSSSLNDHLFFLISFHENANNTTYQTQYLSTLTCS